MSIQPLTTQQGTDAIIQIVLDAVDSPHTRRAYGRALNDFLAWYAETGQTGLNKATVQRYAAELRAGGKGASSINQRLSAIRKLAREAADIGNGRIFRPINKRGRIVGERMTPQAIRDVVVHYADALGLDVAPHDLRRTFAKLAHKGGAGLD